MARVPADAESNGWPPHQPGDDAGSSPAHTVAAVSALVVVLGAAVIVADGWLRWVAALGLVVFATLASRRHKGSWSRAWVVVLVAPVSLASLAITSADITEN